MRILAKYVDFFDKICKEWMKVDDISHVQFTDFFKFGMCITTRGETTKIIPSQ